MDSHYRAAVDGCVGWWWTKRKSQQGGLDRLIYGAAVVMRELSMHERHEAGGENCRGAGAMYIGGDSVIGWRRQGCVGWKLQDALGR